MGHPTTIAALGYGTPLFSAPPFFRKKKIFLEKVSQASQNITYGVILTLL